MPLTDVPADDPRRQGRSFTVEVRVWGDRYDWNFGDGRSLDDALARQGRTRAESDVQHTYEHSSLPFPGGFPVRLTVEYAAEFRVDGGGPQGLPPVRRTYEAAFRGPGDPAGPRAAAAEAREEHEMRDHLPRRRTARGESARGLAGRRR